MDSETKAFMREIAEDAASKAVRHTFLTLGMDPGNPIEAQKDMAALRELRGLVEDDEFQKDLVHLRRWRRAVDSVESKGLFVGLGLMCVGGLALVVYVVKLKMFGS